MWYYREIEVKLVHQAQQVLLETQELLDLKVIKDLQVHLANGDHKDSVVLLDPKDHLVEMDQMVTEDPPGQMESMVHLYVKCFC